MRTLPSPLPFLICILTPLLLAECKARPPEQGAAVTAADTSLARPALSAEASVGKAIFFDKDLALNRNQSCEACHGEQWGYTGPETAINAHGGVYEGSIPSRFGNRKPPSAAYATPSPVLHYDTARKGYVGGNFWDGRATGKRLGSPTAEQAQGPPLNPVEQALRDEACAVYRVRDSRAAAEYGSVFGRGIEQIRFPADVEALCKAEGAKLTLAPEVRRQVEAEWDNIARAVAAFEGSGEVNQFSSKYDAYLDGKATLRHGREARAGARPRHCALCHLPYQRRATAALYGLHLFQPRRPAQPREPGLPKRSELPRRGAGRVPEEEPRAGRGRLGGRDREDEGAHAAQRRPPP